MKTSTTESAYEFEVSSAVTAVDKDSTYPIKVTPMLVNPIAGVTLDSCTINTAENTCINKISLPKDKFIAGKELLVTFKTTAANDTASKDVIISDYSVGSTLKGIHNENELIDAFKEEDTSGKLFLLEADIALVNNWTPVNQLKNAIFDGQGHKITGLTVVRTSGTGNTGMFMILADNTLVINLNLEGTVSTTTSYPIGMLAGETYGKNIRIANSNFKSKVTGGRAAGGVIGVLSGNTIIESVTAISNVKGTIYNGGLLGYANQSSILRNIRVQSVVDAQMQAGGLLGSTAKGSHTASNIVVDSTINVRDNANNREIGGLFGSTNVMSMSNIDATVNITAGKALQVGGVVGKLSWGEGQDSLSNVIARGMIVTLLDPRESTNQISGVASTEKKSQVHKVVDFTTIVYDKANYSSSLASPYLDNYESSALVYYKPFAGATFIDSANPKWVAELAANTAATQKTLLEDKGFDFINTWTIKKINSVDSIGIKEDSIPQFPVW